MDELTMRRRVVEARVGRLATVTPTGRPHVVPCCFVLAAGVIYSAIDAKPKSTHELQRVRNLEANSAASLLIDHYDDDWSTLWWIRIDGRARIVATGAERDGALALLADKYVQYVEQAPPGPVIALDVTGWRTWP